MILDKIMRKDKDFLKVIEEVRTVARMKTTYHLLLSKWRAKTGNECVVPFLDHSKARDFDIQPEDMLSAIIKMYIDLDKP